MEFYLRVRLFKKNENVPMRFLSVFDSTAPEEYCPKWKTSQTTFNRFYERPEGAHNFIRKIMNSIRKIKVATMFNYWNNQ